ncbi:MAG: LmbE family protein, partial [Bacteroidota bacterium]
LEIEDQVLTFRRPVRHAFTDRVMGEQVHPLEIMPPVFGELDKSSYLFTSTEPTPIRIKVTSAKADISGTVELCTPEAWKVTPAKQNFTLKRKGEEQYFEFMMTPPAGQAQGEIIPLVRLEDNPEEGYTRKLVKIEHDHIPVQLADLDASAPVAKLDLEIAGRNIGYLPGAGDAIPEALENIGFKVTTLDKGMITTGDLRQFDAIVVGIRAYNTNTDMPNLQPRLLQYVERGGTLVVQYNVSRGLRIPMKEIGPYPLNISRDRTTVEEAEVRILAPDHPVLNYPNKITSADFDGWVQERGLYFPNEWDERYTPILSSNDPGEPARDGGMLVAEYGKGYYVYTGYSFFRELPAGVPGAYRLFANLVGLGNEVRP